MKYDLFKILLLILSQFLVIELEAQPIILDPVINPNHFRIHTIGPDEGLSSGFLESAFQDQYGYIWIATQYGTHIYDGYELRFIKAKISDSVYTHVPSVFHFADDKDGGVWICTMKGLFYYDRVKDEVIPEIRFLNFQDYFSNWIYGISQDSRGIYWVFAATGLILYDREQDTLIHTEVPIRRFWRSQGDVDDFRLTERDDGSVWLPGGPSGLYQYIPETGEFINYLHDPDDPTSISSDYVTDVVEDEEGNLWITTSGGGLNVLNYDGTFEHIMHNSGTSNTIISNSLNEIKLDREGNLLIAGEDGFSIYDTQKEEFTSYKIMANQYTGGTSFNIREVFEDHDGSNQA
jgi:ligand-binding sensor domain-containing protein